MAKRHPSAIKRNRQNEKRRVRNRAVRSELRGKVRVARETIAAGDPAAAQTELRTVVRELDRAVSKGVLHRNAASRRISRLSKQVSALNKAV